MYVKISSWTRKVTKSPCKAGATPAHWPVVLRPNRQATDTVFKRLWYGTTGSGFEPGLPGLAVSILTTVTSWISRVRWKNFQSKNQALQTEKRVTCARAKHLKYVRKSNALGKLRHLFHVKGNLNAADTKHVPSDAKIQHDIHIANVHSPNPHEAQLTTN